MDWVKIKGQHVLFGGLTPTDKGILVMVQALTAELEREPLKEEILDLPGVGQKSLDGLSERLRNRNASLTDIVRKVIEDVTEYQRNKEATKERKRLSRSKQEFVTRDIPVTSRDREEKRREEKNIKEPQAAQKVAAAYQESEDFRALARQVILIRKSRGKSFKDPIAIEKYLAGRYSEFPSEHEDAKSEVFAWEQEQIENVKKQDLFAIELKGRQDLENEIARSRNDHLELLERFEELPVDDREEVEVEARWEYEYDGGVGRPPLNSPLMKTYLADAYRKRMGVEL
jgi:hypothetical protein